MKMIICKICDEEFSRGSTNRVCCSPECSQENKKRATKKSYEKVGRDYQRRWRARNKEHVQNRLRLYHIRTRYGLSKEEHESLLKSQSGQCAICNVSDQELVVDHCHESGHVRGLLCRKCNWMLGHSGDDSDVLRKAAEYIDANRD